MTFRSDRLAEGYRRCAQVTWQHGTTYFWGAALLPRGSRRHVIAIYALCRLADDIVDQAGPQADPASVRARLEWFADGFYAGLDDPAAAVRRSGTLGAIVHTVHALGLPREHFERFFASMARDLVVSEYETWPELVDYMDGSAAVIGEMMLPVLRPASEQAREPARQLGFAFQLTNFLRDVDEDLDRGRVYLPQEDLRRFGVDVHRRRATARWREFMAFQIERNREIYRRADAGLQFLPPASRRCVGTARVLYSEILDEIEAAGYDVFSGRVRVSGRRKVGLAVASRLGVA